MIKTEVEIRGRVGLGRRPPLEDLDERVLARGGLGMAAVGAAGAGTLGDEAGERILREIESDAGVGNFNSRMISRLLFVHDKIDI